jgi:hypothetical protein
MIKLWLGIVLALIGWLVFGQDITNWYWPNEPAPWERVDAVYYPKKGRLMMSIENYDVRGPPQCRAWVRSAAATENDPGSERGDSECSVG